jgi:hypothetical protein
VAPTLVWEGVLLVGAGAASIAFVATANSTLQLASPDAVRGRVMALYALVFLGTTPLGAPVVGWVCQQWNPRAGLLLGGGLTLAAALAAAIAGARHRAAAGTVDVVGPAAARAA